MEELAERVAARLRIEDYRLCRQLLAEAFGTFLLLLIGTSVNVQAATTPQASSLAVPLGWGLALTIAVYASASVSGGHVNPAISLAQFLLGNITGARFFLYTCAQCLGAFLGTLTTYFGHHDDLWLLDGGVRLVSGLNATAPLFATFPTSHMSILGSFFDNVIGSALLSGAICIATDPRHGIPSGLAPLLIGLALTTVGMTYGSNGGFAVNPARDLMPRLFLLVAGYGWESFSYANYSYFWIPIVAPFVGAVVGAWLYKAFVGLHGSSDTLDIPHSYPPEKTSSRQGITMETLVGFSTTGERFS